MGELMVDLCGYPIERDDILLRAIQSYQIPVQVKRITRKGLWVTRWEWDKYGRALPLQESEEHPALRLDYQRHKGSFINVSKLNPEQAQHIYDTYFSKH